MTRSRSLLVALVLLLCAPAGARAATLETGKSCYTVGSQAQITGSGYAPDSPISFTVNGRRLAAAVTSDETGAVAVSYEPPDTRTQRKLVIEATDEAGDSGQTTIYVTRERRVTADPDTSPNVRTWKAVFRLFGFGRGKAFVHYVNPAGKHKKTVRLGRLRGPCGRLKTTKRRVMPFARPQYGVWRLQFDTRRRFSKKTVRKRVIPVRVYRG